MPTRVAVGDELHTAEHILVATGGTPQRPDLPGGEFTVDSDAMFDLEQVPEHLVVVGGGYIGCEFASIFGGLGSRVTMLLRRARILPGFDEEVQRFLAGELVKSGIEIRTDTTIDVIRRSSPGGALDVTLLGGEKIAADTVLQATGREARTNGLGLAAIGVALGERGGILVDDRYCSSVPSIHAVGDVSSRLHLTPVALAEAMVVVDHLFGNGRRKPACEYVPTAVFTHPEVATCGQTEAEARLCLGDSV